MKIVTREFLREKKACEDGYKWWCENCEGLETTEQIKKSAKYNWSWANWLIVRVMSRPQYLAYAIFAAEQVITIYEKKYPNDNRPRKAIKAAQAVLKNDTKENRAAADAAAYAAYAAAYDAADAAADAAAYAAYDAADAAYDVAYAAADAAAYAAYDAADAAYDVAYAAADAAADAADAADDAADAAADARKKLRGKILNYGIKLLYEQTQ